MHAWLRRWSTTVMFMILTFGFSIVLTLQYRVVQSNRLNIRALTTAQLRDCALLQSRWDVLHEFVVVSFTPFNAPPHRYGPEVERYIADRNVVFAVRRKTLLTYLGPRPQLTEDCVQDAPHG